MILNVCIKAESPRREVFVNEFHYSDSIIQSLINVVSLEANVLLSVERKERVVLQTLP